MEKYYIINNKSGDFMLLNKQTSKNMAENLTYN